MHGHSKSSSQGPASERSRTPKSYVTWFSKGVKLTRTCALSRNSLCAKGVTCCNLLHENIKYRRLCWLLELLYMSVPKQESASNAGLRKVAKSCFTLCAWLEVLSLGKYCINKCVGLLVKQLLPPMKYSSYYDEVACVGGRNLVEV